MTDRARIEQALRAVPMMTAFYPDYPALAALVQRMLLDETNIGLPDEEIACLKDQCATLQARLDAQESWETIARSGQAAIERQCNEITRLREALEEIVRTWGTYFDNTMSVAMAALGRPEA